MNAIKSNKYIKKKLLPIFKKTSVVKAVVFGSYAKGKATKDSDIDIYIDSDGKLIGIEFFGLLEEITQSLDMSVDLIEASQIKKNSLIKEEIEKYGVTIYEK